MIVNSPQEELLVDLNRYPAVTAKWLRPAFAEPVTELQLRGAVTDQSDPYFLLAAEQESKNSGVMALLSLSDNDNGK